MQNTEAKAVKKSIEVELYQLDDMRQKNRCYTFLVEYMDDGKGKMQKRMVGLAVQRLFEIVEEKSKNITRKNLFKGNQPVFVKVSCGTKILDFGSRADVRERYSFKLNNSLSSREKFALRMKAAFDLLTRPMPKPVDIDELAEAVSKLAEVERAEKSELRELAKQAAEAAN